MPKMDGAVAEWLSMCTIIWKPRIECGDVLSSVRVLFCSLLGDS